MSYKLYPTEEFKKHAKKIKDVYPDFKDDLFKLSKQLKKDLKLTNSYSDFNILTGLTSAVLIAW